MIRILEIIDADFGFIKLASDILWWVSAIAIFVWFSNNNFVSYWMLLPWGFICFFGYTFLLQKRFDRLETTLIRAWQTRWDEAIEIAAHEVESYVATDGQNFKEKLDVAREIRKLIGVSEVKIVS